MVSRVWCVLDFTLSSSTVDGWLPRRLMVLLMPVFGRSGVGLVGCILNASIGFGSDRGVLRRAPTLPRLASPRLSSLNAAPAHRTSSSVSAMYR